MRMLPILTLAAVLAAGPWTVVAAPAQPAPAQPGPAQPGVGVPAPAQPAAPAARTAVPTQPPLLPTREASVLYRISARDNQVIEVRITTLPDAVAMRIDMPDRTYMLVNQAEHRMAMVVPEELMVMDLPYQAGVQDQFLLNNRMKFTRRGVDTVATVHCTSWDVLLDGNHATVCVTDEGVLLRSVSVDADGKRNTIEAISVSYTPAPASDFLPPQGFDHMAGPGGNGGGGTSGP